MSWSIKRESIVNDKTMFKESPLIKRRTITEEVVDIIRKAIMEGHYANNQQITESRISEEFNISRAPVREALRELTNKGLVTHRRNLFAS
jgi:DNA-binding GntR family transcriptional regulator